MCVRNGWIMFYFGVVEEWSTVSILLIAQGPSVRGRHSPPAMLAQEGKIEILLCEADRCPWLIVGANWRLENAKSLAAMLQENNPDSTWISLTIPRMYLISCSCICDVYMYMPVSKNCRGFVSRMTKRHRHWVCWMSMGGKSNWNTDSKQQPGTCGWSDSKETALFLVTTVTPIFQTKNSIVLTAARHSAEFQRYLLGKILNQLLVACINAL